jgi:phospholipid/cholesterol/gamma-HCH transport system substrate-binding protein
MARTPGSMDSVSWVRDRAPDAQLSVSDRAAPGGTIAGGSQGSSTVARVATIGALVAAVVVVVVLLFGGDDGHEYRLQFETGGQLVSGNEVLMAGQAIGSVDDIDLTDDWQAEVTVTTDEPLREGTEAIIRSTSLSGVANRYVSITQGPEDAEDLPDGTVLTGERTTTPVDLDQLFNALDEPTREGLQNVIKGFAAIYGGAGEEANETYKYFNPGISSTQRVLAELTRDQQVFEDFLVDGSKVMTAIASRRDDLAGFVSNANQALGAIAQENESFDRVLTALPLFFRQANTTFVNLRAALDDLDPLVEASLVGTRDLAPFLADVRPVARKAIPVFRDLRLTLVRKGRSNDLNEILKDLPKLGKRGNTAFPATVAALDASQDFVSVARPYMPDLLGWFTKFGQITAYYDANGHYARIQPAESNLFAYNEALDPTPSQGVLEPIPMSEQFSFFQNTPGAQNTQNRCPGAVTQPNPGWPSPEDHPFLDNGNLGPDDCDPSDVLIGTP